MGGGAGFPDSRISVHAAPLPPLGAALALQDAAEGKAFDKAAAALLEAQLAYTWQNTFGNGERPPGRQLTHSPYSTPRASRAAGYPLTPVGDAVAVSKELYAKYAPFYAGPCGAR